MKDKWLDYYIKIAKETASLSTARRLCVGAVIVKDNRILSVGYNGTPSGWDNNCEIELNVREMGITELYTKKEVLHAEANALMKLCRATESSQDAMMFITHSPCIECAKLIYQAGIKKVFFIDNYKDDIGIKFLNKAGVQVCQVEQP